MSVFSRFTGGVGKLHTGKPPTARVFGRKYTIFGWRIGDRCAHYINMAILCLFHWFPQLGKYDPPVGKNLKIWPSRGNKSKKWPSRGNKVRWPSRGNKSKKWPSRGNNPKKKCTGFPFLCVPSVLLKIEDPYQYLSILRCFPLSPQSLQNLPNVLPQRPSLFALNQFLVYLPDSLIYLRLLWYRFWSIYPILSFLSAKVVPNEKYC